MRCHRARCAPPAARRIPLAGCLAVGVALLAGGGAAAQGLDYAQALDQARQASGQVRSAMYDAQAKGLQADALQHLGGPSASLSGFAGRVSSSFNLDISRLSGTVAAIGSTIPGLDLPALPNTVATHRIFDLRSVSLNTHWPLYTGGRLQALHGLARGRADEAQADLREAEDRTSTTVAQRYFALQLARQALAVRQAALAGIAEHHRAALRLEAIGLIASTERLKAEVALDGAQRDLAKAQSDHEIAQVALTRLLAAAAPVQPSTPLFVHRQSVGSLQSFIDAGMAGNPAWQKIASKRAQADQALNAQGSAHTPTVVALGSYDLNRSSDKLVQPNWAVGVMVAIPLVSAIDQAKLKEAAQLDRLRVDASAEQARRDVPTLIESQWRAQENARASFAALDSTLRLAQENLRLQTLAFRQSQGTSLDVTDARLNLARVETERLQAAYDYVMALARLLESTGQPARLAEWARSAEVQLPAAAE